MPPNDEREGATAFASLPFTDALDTRSATSSAEDGACVGAEATVWYRFVNAEARWVSISTAGSSYETTIDVFEAPIGDPGAPLTGVACNGHSGADVRFVAQGGREYYLMIGSDGAEGADLSLLVREAAISKPTIALGERTITYGERVPVTVTLPAFAHTENDVVSIWKTPYGGTRTLVAEGAVNDHGKFTVLVPADRRSTFQAEWGGDDRYLAAKSSSVTVTVRARVTNMLSRYASIANGVHIYRGRNPLFHIAVAPNHAGKCVYLDVDVRAGGRWHDLDAPCFRLDSRSRVHIEFTGVAKGYLFRVAGVFRGDTDHASGRGKTLYFEAR